MKMKAAQRTLESVIVRSDDDDDDNDDENDDERRTISFSINFCFRCRVDSVTDVYYFSLSLHRWKGLMVWHLTKHTGASISEYPQKKNIKKYNAVANDCEKLLMTKKGVNGRKIACEMKDERGDISSWTSLSSCSPSWGRERASKGRWPRRR